MGGDLDNARRITCASRYTTRRVSPVQKLKRLQKLKRHSHILPALHEWFVTAVRSHHRSGFGDFYCAECFDVTRTSHLTTVRLLLGDTKILRFAQEPNGEKRSLTKRFACLCCTSADDFSTSALLADNIQICSWTTPQDGGPIAIGIGISHYTASYSRTRGGIRRWNAEASE